MALEDILKQMGNAPMTRSSMADVVNRAALLSKAITGFQKEQRAEPFADVLQQLGESYKKAADPTMMNQFNQQASKTRADYIASGGSPIDMPKELWGADPSKGFQTGAGQFTPGYAGDNLSRGQKERQSGITGIYEGRMTPSYRGLVAGISGRDPFTGSPTQEALSSERQANLAYQNMMDDSTRGWAGLGWQQQKYGLESESESAKRLTEAKRSGLESAYKYIDGLTPKYGDMGIVTKPGWSTSTKAQMKKIVSAMLDGMMENGQSVRDVEENIRAKYPGTSADIINALYNAESQLQSGK